MVYTKIIRRLGIKIDGVKSRLFINRSSVELQPYILSYSSLTIRTTFCYY